MLSAWVPRKCCPLRTDTSHRAVAMNLHQSTGSLSSSHRPGDCKLNYQCSKTLCILTWQTPVPVQQPFCWEMCREHCIWCRHQGNRYNKNTEWNSRIHEAPKFENNKATKQEWWLLVKIPARRRLRQEDDHEFKDTLARVKSCLALPLQNSAGTRNLPHISQSCERARGHVGPWWLLCWRVSPLKALGKVFFSPLFLHDKFVHSLYL